jgi:integrase
MHHDGAGLYLQVAPSGARSWVFRFELNGRERAMGLGSARLVFLAAARELARECRAQLVRGVDPIAARKARRNAQQLEAAKAVSFREWSERYLEMHKAGWRNAKHAAQWRSTLAAYAYPIFGGVSVADVDTAVVVKALQPIWLAKHETATRVRQRIEAILDAAKAMNFRAGDNPARWRGHLKNLLPRRGKAPQAGHHAALPFDELPDFMAKLREQRGTAAAALEFTILTAARTGETIAGCWSEIDFDDAVWTVPADRIKGGKEHRVPLSAPAVEILRRLQRQQQDAPARDDKFVFRSDRRRKHLSNMAMLALLERMGRDDITTHGFRSTFRDWAAERTNFPAEVAEMALAHVVGDKVEAAYRRGDLFEKRRRLMDAWAKFCNSPARGGDVVPLRAGNRPGGTG